MRHYLAYISMLVDVALSDMVMSALHFNDLAVIMKQRMLVEYATKGQYFADHPDYALYMMTMGRLKNQLVVEKTADAASPQIPLLEKQIEDNRQKFMHVAHLKPVSFRTMIEDIMSGAGIAPQSAGSEAYATLYKLPSSFMHGDPDGIPYAMPRDDAGNLVPRIRVTNEELNAMIVDAGANALMFCGTFVECYHPGNASFERRIAGLDDDFKVLAVRNAYGRDPQAISDLIAQIDARGIDYRTHYIAL